MTELIGTLYTIYWCAIGVLSVFAATLLVVAIRHALTSAW